MVSPPFVLVIGIPILFVIGVAAAAGGCIFAPRVRDGAALPGTIGGLVVFTVVAGAGMIGLAMAWTSGLQPTEVNPLRENLGSITAVFRLVAETTSLAAFGIAIFGLPAGLLAKVCARSWVEVIGLLNSRGWR